MTTIRLISTPDNRISGFEITGHAGAGNVGNDLVCAAVSMLSITCANALLSVAGVDRTIINRDAHLAVYVNEKDLTPEATVILKTFQQGAIYLNDTYPENVKLIPL